MTSLTSIRRLQNTQFWLLAIAVGISHKGSSSVTKLNSNEWWFNPIFRIAGYGLLALSLFDIVDIFVSPRFADPVWEFQMLTSLVDRAPVPLLGLVLVEAGENNLRIVKFLSWASLVVGVLFILLIPLGVSCTFRIEQQNQLQISTQLSQQTTQLQQMQDQLSKATTVQDINNVLIRLNPNGRFIESNNPQLIRSQLLSEIAQTEKKVKAIANEKQANARLLLVKNALNYNLAALVCGVVFPSIWGKTRRVLKSNTL